MILSRFTLKNVQNKGLIVPSASVFELPEKVLQFGTGVLLRGLPDYFIDKANRQGVFNGRVVVVKSTDSGDSGVFEKQDGLYTLCVRGLENGVKIEENIICSSISRVLSAKEDWSKVLQCAHNPAMNIVISNTTEVGIQLVKENISKNPPSSFPGKLLAFLYERYKAFDGSDVSGMVIVPTELIVDNGKKLESIVLELAHFNGLEEGFTEWVNNSNHFCSSLVDRIVPGKPDAVTRQQLESVLGYSDDLLSMSEVYRLWAIEGNEHVQSVLSFAQADKGVIVAPDIDSYRELKLRLLNGAHTLSCGLAFLSGFSTVKNAMDNQSFSSFVEDLMLKEIAEGIPYQLPAGRAREFGLQVLDRFRNPHLEHQWISITMQYTSKMKMRNIPVLLKYYETHDSVPGYIALGFAAYLLFMKADKKEGDKYHGLSMGQFYPINDDKAAYFYELWQLHTPDELADVVLRDESVWGTDLTQLSGFAVAVKENLRSLIEQGPAATLGTFQSTSAVAGRQK
ncbi:MAG: tagaturonate reductase [Chitinophagaceae bacterium]|nr:tagaturonate reductase [Chitinophagaceae bacterium]